MTYMMVMGGPEVDCSLKVISINWHVDNRCPHSPNLGYDIRAILNF